MWSVPNMRGSAYISHSQITTCPFLSGPLCPELLWLVLVPVHQVAKPSSYPLWFCTGTSQGSQGALLPLGIWAQEQGLTLINCLDFHVTQEVLSA